ncbi:MAG: rhodanese-like domain-containing protein [Thermodesulfobacteriota bacterium]
MSIPANRPVTFLCILFLSLFCSQQAYGGAPKTLTAPEVKHLMDKGDALLVHTLSAIEFDMQHIPNSINIPVIYMTATDLLPEDKEKTIIFYCMGVR